MARQRSGNRSTNSRDSGRGIVVDNAGEPVSWRDGVHVTGTAIWCDARRARDVCFVSSADRVVRAGHGQIIATRETAAQLGGAVGEQLTVPYRRPFTLGAVGLELMPSGHALGAAALWVEHGGRRTIYAGPMAARHHGLGEPAEIRACDALVIAAPYGRKVHAFPSPTDAAAQLVAWAVDVARNAVPVVLVTSIGKGLDVAAALTAGGLDVVAHRAIHHTAQRLRTAGIATPAVHRAGKRVAAGRALVWSLRDRARLDGIEVTPRKVALVSGLAVERDAVAAASCDVAFAWSNSADRDELIGLVRASAASQVFVTGRCADDIVRALGGSARRLGPPEQMSLFAAEKK
jgi:hypothetical protein